MALPAHPRFFFCPTWNETNFLGDYTRRGPFDSALIPARNLAPHPAGSSSAHKGLTGRELADCLAANSAAYTVDPDTPALATADASGFPTPRLATMAHAEVLPLPLSLLSFTNPADRVDFVQACVGGQAGAEMLVAPYFGFEMHGDRWQKLNLQLIADSSQMADRPVAAFAYASAEALRRGAIRDSADDYADAGAEVVFLRVAGFDPMSASDTTVEAYRRTLAALADAGLLTVAEAVGRFGLVLAGSLGSGFSSGARHRQFTPEQPIYRSTDEMTSEKMRYEVPDRWYALPHSQARRDQRAGLLPACPDSACGALVAGMGPSDLTEHLVHYFTIGARRSAARGAQGTRQLLAANESNAPRAWLNAV
jgi:hypothetical protein